MVAQRVDPMTLHLQAAARGREVFRLHRAVLGALRLTWEASRGGFVAAAAFQAVGALAMAATVVVGQFALTALLDPSTVAARSGLFALVLLAVVMSVATGAAALQSQQQRLLGEQVGVAAWQRVLSVAGRVDLELYESPRFFDRLERVRTNALIRPLMVTTAVFGLFGSVLAAVGLLVALLSIDPLLVPVLLLAGVPSIVLARRVSLREFRFVASASPVFRARDYLRQVLTGREEAKEIRAFGAEPALRSRHDARSDALIASLRRHVRTRQAYALGAVATTTIALLASLGLLVYSLSVDRIDVAQAGAAALGIRLLSTRLDQMFQSFAEVLESSVFLDDLDEFLNLAPRHHAVERGVGPTFEQEITVDCVSYTYPGGAQPVLIDVSLSVARGEVIAIVGENGSGKTTLAKIIAGLYAPTGGRILWDDVDVADLAPTDVRRSVSVIFQDFVRYQLTAQENIGLGDPAHVDDAAAARRAAVQAGADGFLYALPARYDTVLSTEYAGGIDLSVGQWQRVALARALRREAPLLILDEPSSALDPRAEQALFGDVRRMLDGRAAVLISHRYSTVRSADRIYVMRDGRVVEAGSHDTLMARAGLYAELFSLQAEAYL